MVQELTVRLGLHTGRGQGELIREWFGPAGRGSRWLGLAAATIGSLVTEFTGVAGIGELYGLSRAVSLPIAAAALLAVVATGSYRRVERAAILVGLFELAFFAVAWAAHPSLGGDGEGCARPAARRSRLHVSGRGGHRGDVQSLDDLLPAVGDRRKAARPGRPRAPPAGTPRPARR